MSIGLEDFPLLRSVNLPADLRAQPESRLGELCTQLREFLIRSVATRGGHFAAMEQPELLVDDVRAFFRDLRARPPVSR